MTWQAAALCAQTDPDAWFPGQGDSGEWALAVCRRCPVLAICDADTAADDAGRPDADIQGIRGGRTGGERRRREKARRSANHTDHQQKEAA
jgi:WhiB family transcriptional regulator, redox-sensing transcriptional regulator